MIFGEEAFSVGADINISRRRHLQTLTLGM